jgi:CheY-like chemotaxis protein
MGIPEEKHRLIFEPFTQADGSTTRKHGGTGLGLAIASHLAQLMGGQLWVESVVGQGSIFHFTARFTAQSQALTTSPGIERIDIRDLPVLVVDDNATNRRILHDILTHWGMRPTVVESGEAALEMLEHAAGEGQRFRLVLLDAQMPGMDGFAVAEQISYNPRFKGVTILMLSSGDQGDIKARSRQTGVVCYLRKPITRSELWEAMIAALGRSGIQEVRAEQAVYCNAAQNCQPTLAITPQRSLRILLAEDNIVNQRLVVRLLEKHGHTTFVASTGHEVLAVLAQQAVDLVLMDVQMPDMDGLEATAVIREQERQRGGHLPIIALTAHAMKGDQERCLASGMDDYISKPINAQILSTAISRVLNRISALNLPASELPLSLAVAVDAKS